MSMYPLHKFVPLPFGTYMIYIEDDKKKVDVRIAPKDLRTFKADLAKKKVKNLKQPSFQRKDEGSGTGMQSYARTSVKQDRPFTEKTIEPSYQMRFLQHNGQVVTEQPPNITVIDSVTGADVTTAAPWMKSRPQRWNEMLKVREIENPKLTSTLRQYSEEKTVRKPRLQAGENILESAHDRKNVGTVQRTIEIPSKDVTGERLQRSMQPHLHKPVQHSRETDRRAAREQAARRRRMRVDKIMHLVSSRARDSAIRSSAAVDQTLTTSVNTRTGQRLNGRISVSLPPPSVGKIPPLAPLVETSESNEWRKSNSELQVATDEAPLLAKDWNPRAEQTLMNQVILERLGNAVPYQWHPTKQPNPQTAGGRRYVL